MCFKLNRHITIQIAKTDSDSRQMNINITRQIDNASLVIASKYV